MDSAQGAGYKQGASYADVPTPSSVGDQLTEEEGLTPHGRQARARGFMRGAVQERDGVDKICTMSIDDLKTELAHILPIAMAESVRKFRSLASEASTLTVLLIV